MILHIYIFKTPASSFSKFFYCFLVSNFFLLWYFKFMPSHIGLSLFFIFYFLKVSILVIYLRFLFFLLLILISITFPLRTAFQHPMSFDTVVSIFSSFRILKISLLIIFMTHWLFRRVLFNLHILVSFPAYLLEYGSSLFHCGQKKYLCTICRSGRSSYLQPQVL